MPPEFLAVSVGANLAEKLRQIDGSKDRIRLDQLLVPPPVKREAEALPDVAKVTADDAKKLFRVGQMEAVKSRLRETGKSWISYPEFVRICGDVCSNPEQGSRVASILDQSGNVIVLGNSVCLKPEQVTEAIASQIPLPNLAAGPNDPRMKELEALESEKAKIDEEADASVRRELWAGLAYLVVQTAGFVRLTFWELSWDVMEPICFYVTSTYFMAGYAFFLRTSKEPSFEGFYRSRFEAKQRRLMECQGFDVHRYDELRRRFGLEAQHPGLGFGLLPRRRRR